MDDSGRTPPGAEGCRVPETRRATPGKLARCSSRPAIAASRALSRVSKKTAAVTACEPDPDDRHRSRCNTCKCPHREDIERGYLSWEPTRRLAAEFKVDEKSIRRHVTWFGLDLERNGNLKRALGRIVEAGMLAAQEGKATLDHALKALKILAHLRGAGPDVEPDGTPTWEDWVRLAELERQGRTVPRTIDG